jgi:hypothetical protein
MSTIRFACPHCRRALSIDSRAAGRERPCPSCRGRVRVPAPRLAGGLRLSRAALPLLAAASAVLLAVCLAFGLSARPPAAGGDEPAGATPASPASRKNGGMKTCTRDEFRKKALGASTARLRAALGAPDAIELPTFYTSALDQNEGYWSYEGRTLNPDTGKPDASADVWIERGTAVRITFR